MSYYITAHRGNRRINMPIEEKHRYITDTVIPAYSGNDIIGYSQELDTNESYINNQLPVMKTDFRTEIEDTGTTSTGYTETKKGSSKSEDGIVNGLNLSYQQIKLFYRPEQLHIEQGTGAQERIGDKVFLKNVNIMINLSATQEWLTYLSPNDKTQINSVIKTYDPVSFTAAGVTTGAQTTTTGTITSNTSTANLFNVIDWRKNIRQWAKFRIMIVRFNDLNDEQTTNETDLKYYIQNWFNTIFVPSAIIPNTTIVEETGESVYKDINIVSNQSTMKRESTPYNGKYQIMYDKVIELGQNDMNKFIQIDLEPKMNLTFENDENGYSTPTSERYNNVYGFIIPPTYYRMDMDTCTYQTIETSSYNTELLATFTTNIKFTYYDI